MGKALVVLALVVSAQRASAEPRNAIVVELLGKGGLWGAGYELHLSERFAIGGVGSYYQLGGDRYTTLAPYVAAYPIARTHHAWFAQLGPQLVHRAIPSPVPEWQGMTTNGMSVAVASGYEYRRSWFARAYAMASVGAHAAPWLGLAFGRSW